MVDNDDIDDDDNDGDDTSITSSKLILMVIFFHCGTRRQTGQIKGRSTRTYTTDSCLQHRAHGGIIESHVTGRCRTHDQDVLENVDRHCVTKLIPEGGSTLPL